MVTQPQAAALWTVEEYLHLERHSNVKHEYHGGYVYAMAGGTQRHNQIAVNICTVLRTAVRGTGCRVFTSEVKIRQSADDYVYPDVAVTCDPRDNVPGQVWIDYPSLVIEVLSKSTAHEDRGAKFDAYKGIPSLREYLLIEYRRREVTVWRRDEAGTWAETRYDPADEVPLHHPPVTLTMDLIYEDSGL